MSAENTDDRPHPSERIGAMLGLTGGQVWTLGVLLVVIVLLFSSLRGLA